MILITGHSSKSDGFCLLAETDSVDEACRTLLSQWSNARIVEWRSDDDLMSGVVLADADVDDAEVRERAQNGNTGRGCYDLNFSDITPGLLMGNMPW